MANSASVDDFRLRCRSALTHPVTAAALCLLVVNDWLLKPVSPNPWTTGKISDFAWVIFASPALAFALAAGAGAFGGAAANDKAARRAIWVAAYVGLPLLYAAFNTFQPVHGAALSAMSLIGGGAGSPMDPADSLVIPIGAAVAVWAWRRPPARAESLRVRLGLAAALPLTALGVAFGAVAGFRFDFSKPVFLAFAIILALAFARVLNRRNSQTERRLRYTCGGVFTYSPN